MYQAPEQFMHIGKANLETALTLANITLQSTERLLDLSLKTAREALDQSLRSAKALTEAKNVQDFVTLQSSQTQPSLDKVMAYSRSVYEVASDTQTRMSKVVESRFTALNGDLMAALDQAMKSAPAGSERAFAAFKSAMAVANSAYDTLSRATRQATEAAAAQPMVQASKAAKKKAH